MRVRLARALVTMLVWYQLLAVAQSQTVNGPDGKPLNISNGMTLHEAITALKPEYQTYALGGDSGWGLQIHDNASWEEVLLTLWSDESQDYTINYAATVRVIMIHSPKYKTKEGVHVGMQLADAEKKLGKIDSIYTREPTMAEYATFTNMPKKMEFGVSGGIFEDGQRVTKRYSADAHITMINLVVGYVE